MADDPEGRSGRRLGRWLLWLVLFAVVVVVLFTVVFPWFDRTFVDDPVLGALPSGWRGGSG